MTRPGGSVTFEHSGLTLEVTLLNDGRAAVKIEEGGIGRGTTKTILSRAEKHALGELLSRADG